MKRNLLINLWLMALLLPITIPLTTKAQCLCDGGVPANVLKYNFKLDTTSMPAAIISFPKFDPTIGVLSCLRFNDTLSLITSSHVTNNALIPVTYKFLLNVTNDFSGPGISVNESASRIYGPDLLADSGKIGSQIVYGPDTLFKNSIHQTYTSDVADYLGVGNVDFNYIVNGGLIGQQGGIKYAYEIVSKYWGNFGLTYYWCPNLVLSTNIKNFAAVKSNKNVNLSWIVGNDLISNTYEIQISKNSREFYAIGSARSNTASSGASSKYTYQYNPDQAVAGQLYFRIKQTDANGKITYSAIKTLNMDKSGASAFSAFPNPASGNVSLQFDANLNGDYKIDVTNQLGQNMISRPIKLQNTSLIPLNLGSVKAPGMYYVRVKDISTGQIFTNKILVNN